MLTVRRELLFEMVQFCDRSSNIRVKARLLQERT